MQLAALELHLLLKVLLFDVRGTTVMCVGIEVRGTSRLGLLGLWILVVDGRVELLSAVAHAPMGVHRHVLHLHAVARPMGIQVGWLVLRILEGGGLASVLLPPVVLLGSAGLGDALTTGRVHDPASEVRAEVRTASGRRPLSVSSVWSRAVVALSRSSLEIGVIRTIGRVMAGGPGIVRYVYDLELVSWELSHLYSIWIVRHKIL